MNTLILIPTLWLAFYHTSSCTITEDHNQWAHDWCSVSRFFFLESICFAVFFEENKFISTNRHVHRHTGSGMAL